MELADFVRLVSDFGDLSHPERIKHFGWYLHAHSGRDTFDAAAIRECYAAVHMVPPPDVAREFRRLVERTQILPSGTGYRLEHRVREELSERYGHEQTTIAISRLLASLPGRISNDNEKTFLAEVLRCYGAEAFRASTVMTWNLTYDHLLNWIIASTSRLRDFSVALASYVANDKRRAGMTVQAKGDFEDLKESEVLNICQRANLITHSLKQLLDIGLTRRNHAAHPSGIEISRATAEEMIDTLVANVVLKLT